MSAADPWALPGSAIPPESQHAATPEERRAAAELANRRRLAESAVDEVRLREAELEQIVDSAGSELSRMKAETRLEAARRRAATATDNADLAAADLAEIESAVLLAAQQMVQPATPQLLFHSLPEFVNELVCPTFRRELTGKGSGFRWSARWFESAEAIMRLEAMWRSFESLRLDGATGISVWLRDHADYHLAVLMSSDGPFSESREPNRCTDPLPYAAPPEGMFPVF